MILRTSAEGFAIDDGVAVNYRWGDIRSVVAFKRDLMTTDLVVFHVTTAFGSVEINEEMPGFDEVERAMAAHLPGFRESWRELVIKPAFATNDTRLFDASGSSLRDS